MVNITNAQFANCYTKRFLFAKSHKYDVVDALFFILKNEKNNQKLKHINQIINQYVVIEDRDINSYYSNKFVGQYEMFADDMPLDVENSLFEIAKKLEQDKLLKNSEALKC